MVQRIAATRPPSRQLGLVNAAISGNRLITQRPGAGVNAQARLDRDVLSHAGVHTMVLLEGINDLYGTKVTAPELISAQRQIAARARNRGLRVVVGTLIPSHRGAYTTERETVRTTLNDFRARTDIARCPTPSTSPCCTRDRSSAERVRVRTAPLGERPGRPAEHLGDVGLHRRLVHRAVGEEAEERADVLLRHP